MFLHVIGSAIAQPSPLQHGCLPVLEQVTAWQLLPLLTVPPLFWQVVGSAIEQLPLLQHGSCWVIPQVTPEQELPDIGVPRRLQKFLGIIVHWLVNRTQHGTLPAEAQLTPVHDICPNCGDPPWLEHCWMSSILQEFDGRQHGDFGAGGGQRIVAQLPPALKVPPLDWQSDWVVSLQPPLGRQHAPLPAL